jgi:hypothetical protein
MIPSHGWLNPTRAVGLAAYGTAVTCCGIAWIKTKTPRAARLAALLIVIESMLLLDIAFSCRLILHDVFSGFAQRHNEYAARRLPQEIVLSILFGMLLLGLLLIWRFFPGRVGARLAISGGVFSVALWWTEVISLHQVDHAFYYRLGGIYHPLGDLMAVGMLWILAALMAAAGILIDSGS